MQRLSAERLELEASQNWEAFYKTHGAGFFKDRHYLARELPELKQGCLTVLEVGCGVGNTTFPILQVNSQAFVHACDFSPTAIQCLMSHEEYSDKHIHAFVADITSDRLTDSVPEASVDICTMIFVLSALSPDKMEQAIRNVSATLKEGGLVFVRDYAQGDLAEDKLSQQSSQRCISTHFYARGDGTRAFYFSETGLKSIFKTCGLECKYVRLHERMVENRGQNSCMQRRWIQALFKLPGSQKCTARAGNLADNLHQHVKNGKLLVMDGEPEPRESHSKGVGLGEWEAEEQLHAIDEGVGDLFGGSHKAEEVEEVFHIAGAGSFKVRSISREHKHTLSHTGLMLWDAAPPFADFLAKSGSFLNGKRILELGCGSNPLLMFAALRNARLVVSTDGSPEALRGMCRNLDLNASKVFIERARLAVLAWGDGQHISDLQKQYSGGFDVIFGADVVYVEEFVPHLFKTARALISPTKQARLLLCHVTRRVSESQICSIAEEMGFVLLQDDFNNQVEELDYGPFRLLCFETMSFQTLPAK